MKKILETHHSGATSVTMLIGHGSWFYVLVRFLRVDGCWLLLCRMPTPLKQEKNLSGWWFQPTHMEKYVRQNGNLHLPPIVSGWVATHPSTLDSSSPPGFRRTVRWRGSTTRDWFITGLGVGFFCLEKRGNPLEFMCFSFASKCLNLFF